VQGISDLIAEAGLINLDFADVKTIMNERGIAHMGVGRGSGEDRVSKAVKEAIESPLLETSINGAKAILLNITGGYDLGMLEVNEAADLIEKAADRDAIVIFGTSIKEDMENEIKITVIATGFEDRGFETIVRLDPKENETDTERKEGTIEDYEPKLDGVSKYNGLGTSSNFDIPSFLKENKGNF
jgi:cell division protein FtsZ